MFEPGAYPPIPFSLFVHLSLPKKSPDDLTLLAVSSSSQEFRFNFFDPISIKSRASHFVSVVFLAHSPGQKSCEVTLVTSEGEVVAEMR